MAMDGVVAAAGYMSHWPISDARCMYLSTNSFVYGTGEARGRTQHNVNRGERRAQSTTGAGSLPKPAGCDLYDLDMTLRPCSLLTHTQGP